MSDLLSFLRLRSLFTTGELESTVDSTAIFAAGDALLGEDAESKEAVLGGFLSGSGEFEGVPCTLSFSLPFLSGDHLINIFV